jgi:hypothetical protein
MNETPRFTTPVDRKLQGVGKEKYLSGDLDLLIGTLQDRNNL